jgi:hypothetical protein
MEALDFTDFWAGFNPFFDDRVGAPATDEMLSSAEKALGYKLPEAYKTLLKSQNGGVPRRPFLGPLKAESIMGADPEQERSIVGSRGSEYLINEWELPDYGVYFGDLEADCPDCLFLDYRDCGPEGEPAVSRLDMENAYEATRIAPDFGSFIQMLRSDKD